MSPTGRHEVGMIELTSLPAMRMAKAMKRNPLSLVLSRS